MTSETGDIAVLYRAYHGTDIVRVVDHVWTGQAVLAVIVLEDGRISDVTTKALRVVGLTPDEPSTQPSWRVGEEMDTFWWTDRRP